MGRQRVFQVAAFVAVFAIYIAARCWNLTRLCLWFDEIFSVHAAEHSWSSILGFISLDLIHPPLFYLLLKIWIAIGGESLLWLRTFPVVFSVIAIVPFVLFCRVLKLGVWTMILALFLVAVNGSLIKYAQEVRMYSMLMCLSVFSLWLFARYFQLEKGILGLAIVNVLLVYAHYFGWFVVTAEVVAVLLLRRELWQQAVLLLGAALVAFLPWTVMVLRAAAGGSSPSQNIGWVLRPGLFELIQLAFSLVEPFYYAATSIDPMSVFRVSMPVLLIVVITIVLLIARAKDPTLLRSLYVLAILVTVPAAAAFLASWLLPYSVWGGRHLIIVFVPFLVIAAHALVSLVSATLRIAALALVLLLMGYGYLSAIERPYTIPPWCAFEPLLMEMRDQPENGQIYVLEDLIAYHLWFSLRHNDDQYRRWQVTKIENFAGLIEDKAYFLPRGFDEVLRIEPAWLNDGPFWIVYRAPEFNRGKPPLDTFIRNGYEVRQQLIHDAGPEKAIAISLERNR